MGIILILAGIILGVQRGVYYSQAVARARADMAVMATGLEQFKTLYGDYPWINSAAAGEDLYWVFLGKTHINPSSRKMEEKEEEKEWRPLLDVGALKLDGTGESKKIQDPWGNQYMYFYRPNYSDDEWENPSFLLMSKGPDGKSATSGDWTGTGIIPDDFFTNAKSPENLDNIIYGYEN